jgi:Fe-coproporphyrin III synthase
VTSIGEILKRQAGQLTHHIYSLPVLILELTGRCNCRCVMCDIWRTGGAVPELTIDQLRPHVEAFPTLGVRHVVLSGGEPLLHHDPWAVCTLLRAHGVEKITLLSAGLLLARHAAAVLTWCDAAIVSLDGRRDVHDAIRGVPHAYDRLAEGVAALKAGDPGFKVTARCVVQRRNHASLPGIVDAAHELGLDGISFLMADVSSTAFNRPARPGDERSDAIALSPADVPSFHRAIEETITRHASDIESGFVAESAARLRRLGHYAAALNGEGPFPPIRCNAPWVSAVVEPDGTVRPCFFHAPLGRLAHQPLDQILNSTPAVTFRRHLDVTRDPTCQKCVCTLHVGPRTDI